MKYPKPEVQKWTDEKNSMIQSFEIVVPNHQMIFRHFDWIKI